VKDSLLNLLLFTVTFAVVAVFVLGAYFLYNSLVPGGRGLIFGSPWATALFPGLLVALLVAQYRSVHHPGRFLFTWLALAGAFFLLLSLSIPAIGQAPSIRSPDAPPLVSGRFLLLEDDGSLLAPPGKPVEGQFARGVLSIPSNQSPMVLLESVPFDPLNQRFLLPADQGGAKSLLETGPERAYFGYPDFYRSLQEDLFVVYQALRQSWGSNGSLYLAQAGAITGLFLGLFAFFSFRTWPLVQLILVLFMLRVAVGFLAYSLNGLPVVVSNWWPDPGMGFLRQWIPVVWVALASAALVFTTVLTKPHHVEALS
jgi:hypothetical protein